MTDLDYRKWGGCCLRKFLFYYNGEYMCLFNQNYITTNSLIYVILNNY